VDRGKPGSKMHVLSDADVLPLRVGLSAANTHHSQALKSVLSYFHMGHEYHASASKPRRPHADKGVRHPSPAAMTLRQAHRRPRRPQRHRLQRAARPPQMGHRVHHVLTDRLPPTQPPL
jgi:hypothetical protein